MLVLIDESGDTGFKEGSSRYFIITMVVFRDGGEHGRYLAAEHTAAAIHKVKEDTRHKPEFHFSQCSHKIRQAFFQELNRQNCSFEVYSLVVDKKKIHSPHLQSHTKDFYNFILKQLLSHNPVNNAKIKIDGEKSKVFLKALQSYLRRGQDGMLNKLKFANSKTDVLVQLADMTCSAIAYSYNRSDRLESDTYMKLLGKRIKNIWEFQ